MGITWLPRILVTLGVIAIAWTGLTFWVQADGPSKLTEFTSTSDSVKVLIVYDPDPIYNLDEQVCISIAKGLKEEYVNATVATVRATADLNLTEYSALVLCANTYNWAPDASITNFIKSHSELRSIPVIGITIGSGSTAAAAASLRSTLENSGIEILNDHEWWLMRPNDESLPEEKNVDVANDQAFIFGRDIANQVLSRNRTSSAKIP